MNVNSRFAFANHILTLLALAEDEPITSAYIAGSVNTNPVVIRRLLGNLREAGLVTSQPGTGGGWRLLRAPDGISLCEVYRAVEDDQLFGMHHRAPNNTCPVGRNIQQALGYVFSEAERALEQRLAELTIADVLRGVQSADTAAATDTSSNVSATRKA